MDHEMKTNTKTQTNLHKIFLMFLCALLVVGGFASLLIATNNAMIFVGLFFGVFGLGLFIGLFSRLRDD